MFVKLNLIHLMLKQEIHWIIYLLYCYYWYQQNNTWFDPNICALFFFYHNSHSHSSNILVSMSITYNLIWSRPQLEFHLKVKLLFFTFAIVSVLASWFSKVRRAKTFSVCVCNR